MKKCVGRKLDGHRIFLRVLSVLLLFVLLLIPFDTVKAETVSSDSDFVIEDGVLVKYKGSASKVIVPEGVTTISGTYLYDYNGLNWNYSMKTLVLPSSLREIGDFAFCMSPYLEKVVMSEGVTTIGYKAFYECKNLRDITFPESLTYIKGKDAFEETAWLEEKEAESDLVIVNNVLVSGRNAKGEVTVPEGVTRIADSAMAWSAITKIDLPESLVEIGEAVFSVCTQLREVDIQEGVTQIGEFAFEDCWKLWEVEIPKTVAEYNSWIAGHGGPVLLLLYKDSPVHQYAKENQMDYRLLDDDSEDTGFTHIDSDFIVKDGVLLAYKGSASEVVIPEGVTKIGRREFALNGLNHNNTMKSVILPDSLKEIEVGAFEDCPELTEITIPDGVTRIGSHAFANCANLSEVHLSESLEKLRSSAAFLSTPWQEAEDAKADTDTADTENTEKEEDTEKEKIENSGEAAGEPDGTDKEDLSQTEMTEGAAETTKGDIGVLVVLGAVLLIVAGIAAWKKFNERNKIRKQK